MKSAIEMEPVFTHALRDELLQFAKARRRRRPLWFLGAAGAVSVLVGAGVATAAILGLPGSPVSTSLTEQIVVEGSGSGHAELGTVPSDATHVAVEFTCLSAGGYRVATIQITCASLDVGSRSFFDLPIDDLEGSAITIQTSDSRAWKVTAAYIDRKTSPWAVNAKGETYGVINEVGTPDLIAVEMQAGGVGYVRATDLAFANGDPEAHDFRSPDEALRWQEVAAGTSVLLPAFESDGLTQIGVFLVSR